LPKGVKMIKAVIFDMDGVLTETSEQHFLAWNRLANDLGYTLSPTVKDKVRGVSRMESLEIVLNEGNVGGKFTQEEKLEMADRKNHYYVESIRQFTPDNLAKGARELLDLLKRHGMKVALASVSKNSEFLLHAMDIDLYFNAIADPASIKNGKPAPDIFLKSAELLGVFPSECIGVEDAYAGIESIHAAGMESVGVGDPKLLINCSNVLKDLTGVYQYFQSILEP
jgi:beta-phosphoglucomutase